MKVSITHLKYQIIFDLRVRYIQVKKIGTNHLNFLILSPLFFKSLLYWVLYYYECARYEQEFTPRNCIPFV